MQGRLGVGGGWCWGSHGLGLVCTLVGFGQGLPLPAEWLGEDPLEEGSVDDSGGLRKISQVQLPGPCGESAGMRSKGLAGVTEILELREKLGAGLGWGNWEGVWGIFDGQDHSCGGQ